MGTDFGRQAMTGQHGSETGVATEFFHGFEPFPHRGQAVSNDLIDLLREEDVLSRIADSSTADQAAAVPHKGLRLRQVRE